MYKILTEEESLEILKSAHRHHTHSCCPTIPDPAEKVTSFEVIEGVYPVQSDIFKVFRKELQSFIVRNTAYPTVGKLLEITDNITKEEFYNNQLTKENLTAAQKIAEDSEGYFRLIRKSSPKFTNFLMSVIKFAGLNPDNHRLMKKYNDRGSGTLSEYEVIISTEPHRIAGMSAFGQFTSCQDWIEKEEDHEYHRYTHQVWANLLDETVGIIYLRRKDDESPSYNVPNVQDMLARQLVRIAELPNGQNVLYIHKMYAHSPYDIYLRDTLNEWAKSLPDNFHVIVVDRGKSEYDNGTNKHGQEFRGFTTHIHKQERCEVFGEEERECGSCDEGYTRETCQYCEGSGDIESSEEVYCSLCDGTGYLDDEQEDECHMCEGKGWYEDECTETCYECDGEGYIEEECYCCEGTGYRYYENEYYPYNDHTSWLDLVEYTGIEFQVPNYIMKWEEKPKPEPKPKNANTLTRKIGDKVRIRTDLIVGQRYANNCGNVRDSFVADMAEYRGKVFTIDSITTKYMLEGVDWLWTDEMFDRQIRVGDKVRLRPDLEVGNAYASVTLLGGMYSDELKEGTFEVTIVDGNDIKMDGCRYWYSSEMLTLVDPVEVKVNEEIEQAII